MTFAKWLFRLAFVWGVLAVTPLFFMEQTDLGAAASGPARSFYYGFASVALAWQVVYLLIGLDPARYRPMMLVGAAGKVGFGAAVCWLWLMGALDSAMLASGVIDLCLAALFAAAFVATRPRS